MHEQSPAFRLYDNPRLLLIGQDQVTLALVTEEVRAAGFPIRGLTAAEADGSLTGSFDLIAFGSALAEDKRRSLEAEARFHNPGVRFLRVRAPFAASQIVAAVRNDDVPSVDLGAYFDRIGYNGSPRPDLKTLRALVERHVAAIPFEAIDALLDRRIDISPEGVDAKLIGRRRGGYCYEQNALFSRVLKAIGFDVEGLAASVRWNSVPGTVPPPQTHRIQRVMIDGIPWLADVGFGSAVPTAPLRMDIAEPQATRHETYRFVRLGQQMLLQAQVEGQWRPVYAISTETWLDSHYEFANWYTSTHPDSHFRHRLVVTRSTPEARYVLAEGRLTIRRPGGLSEQKYLDADEIMDSLEHIFQLPVEAEWRAIAERASQAVKAERLAEAA